MLDIERDFIASGADTSNVSIPAKGTASPMRGIRTITEMSGRNPTK